MSFHERLRQARTAIGLTGAQVGQKLDVTRGTISGWETGRYSPNPEQLIQLCQVLAVSADWLLGLRQDQTDASPGMPALDADARREALLYQSLSPEDRRRWRVIRTAVFDVSG